jgi:VPDSG-CTERM motif
MQALPKKLLPLTLFAIAVTSLFSVRPVQAYTVTLEQMGANVVANGSGAINLTGLSFIEEGSIGPFINPHVAFIVTGQTGSGSTYDGFTGPTTFGNGVITLPSTSSGDLVGISNSSTPFPFLLVPQGYVSNTALSDSMTFNNATLASLGLTPGTYVWTWGTGLANQNFTLQIRSLGVPPPVPDGGSTVSLLGFALIGLASLRHKLVAKPDFVRS